MPPKLLQEQPLLLEDLLEQEKMEQRRQQQQALLQQKQEQGLLTGKGYFIWAILNNLGWTKHWEIVIQTLIFHISLLCVF